MYIFPECSIGQDTYRGNPWQSWTQNLYAYAGNNPVNYIDPTGHSVGRPQLISGPMGPDLGVTVFFMAGMSADLHDPLIQAFEWGLMMVGYDLKVVDYWQQRPGCTGPCKTDVQVSEWSGAKTGLSSDIAATIAPAVQQAQASGNKAMVIGHSMGGTIAANAVVSLAAQGIHVDSLVLIGGAVSSGVKDKVENSGTPITEVVGSCDKVPSRSAAVRWNPVKLVQLLAAGADANCHQSPAYFEQSQLTNTIDAIKAAKFRPV